MRKLIFTAFLFFSIKGFSQEFIMTYNNYVSKEDTTKNYIILEYPGKTKEELYKLTTKYIFSNYSGSKNHSFSNVENEQIVIDVLSRDYRRMWINLSGGNLWKVSNRYEFNFKDGKIKFTPSFSSFSNTENSSTASYKILFNSKGEPKKDGVIYFTEALVNNFVRDFKKGIEENKSEDW